MTYSATLYATARSVVPAADLREVPRAERTTVDRIARALEAQGSGNARAHRTAILRALGGHIRGQYTDARAALRYLAGLDRRLAVWGACACAREALRYVPEGETRPLRAIETTELWLAGQATLDEVRAARSAAWDAWRSATYAAAYAAYAADATYAAAYAADAAADAAGAWRASRRRDTRGRRALGTATCPIRIRTRRCAMACLRARGAPRLETSALAHLREAVRLPEEAV